VTFRRLVCTADVEPIVSEWKGIDSVFGFGHMGFLSEYVFGIRGRGEGGGELLQACYADWCRIQVVGSV